MSDEPRDGSRDDEPAGQTGNSSDAARIGPDAADSSAVPSAPWERPRRWNQDSLDATRVDDLLARLGTEDAPGGRRRRRQADASDGTGVSASELIAALSAADTGAATQGPAEPRADHHSAEEPAAVTTQVPVVPAPVVPAPVVPAPVVPAPVVPAPVVQAPVVPAPVVQAPIVPAVQAPVVPAPAIPVPIVPAPDVVPAPVAPVPAAPPATPAGLALPSPPPATPAAPIAQAAPAAPVTPVSKALPEDTVLLPPRIGPAGRAPIRDLGADPRTEYIPKITGSVAERAEADSILASLRQQSLTGGGADAAIYGRAGGGPLPPVPPVGGTRGGGQSGRPPRRRRGLLYAGRGIAAALALFTLLGMGVEWKIKDRAETTIGQHQIGGALNTTDPAISTARTTAVVTTNSRGVKTTESAPPKATYAPENILLLGSDTRAGSNGDAGNEGAGTDGTANSDTLMVAHISGDRSHVTILSIPRDTLVPAPKCKIWNSTTGVVSDQYEPISTGQLYHINSAYSVGGPTCTVTAIQSLTHLGITRMIGIDFSGFQAMVDALGGIEVNICRPIVDSELGTVVPTAGEQKIFGIQALNLVRARNVIGDTESDLARIRRQQIVLSAILRQVTTAGTLLNPSKLDNFLQAFGKNTFTQNVKVDDLVTLAGSLGSLDPAHVTFYTLPTVPSTSVSGALDVDETKAPAIFDDLVNDLPLPGEVTTPATTKASSTPTPTPSPAAPSLKLTVAPDRVNLEIYNLTGQDNVAGTAQQKLDAVGFGVTDDQLFKPDTQTQTETTVLYAPTNRAAALTVAAAVPGSTLVVTAGLGKTVRLDLGSSYAGAIDAVKVGETAPSSLATVSTGPSISTTATTGTSGTAAALSSVNAGAGTCV